MGMFAERLKEALELRNMTAAELSRAIGVNEGTISNYKKGVYEPKQRRLESIAEVLKVPIPWLMGGDIPILSPTGKKNPPPLTAEEEKLLSSYNKLNSKGKKEAIKRVNELTQISEYVITPKSNTEEAS